MRALAVLKTSKMDIKVPETYEEAVAMAERDLLGKKDAQPWQWLALILAFFKSGQPGAPPSPIAIEFSRPSPSSDFYTTKIVAAKDKYKSLNPRLLVLKNGDMAFGFIRPIGNYGDPNGNQYTPSQPNQVEKSSRSIRFSRNLAHFDEIYGPIIERETTPPEEAETLREIRVSLASAEEAYAGLAALQPHWGKMLYYVYPTYHTYSKDTKDKKGRRVSLPKDIEAIVNKPDRDLTESELITVGDHYPALNGLPITREDVLLYSISEEAQGVATSASVYPTQKQIKNEETNEVTYEPVGDGAYTVAFQCRATKPIDGFKGAPDHSRLYGFEFKGPAKDAIEALAACGMAPKMPEVIDVNGRSAAKMLGPGVDELGDGTLMDIRGFLVSTQAEKRYSQKISPMRIQILYPQPKGAGGGDNSLNAFSSALSSCGAQATAAGGSTASVAHASEDAYGAGDDDTVYQ